MPIYEFYCDSCNVIFNFYSSRVNTDKRPACPKCQKEHLEKKISAFVTTGKAKESDQAHLPEGFDEERLEKAFMSLMQDADSVSDEDPRQMASLMRKFSDQTGMRLGATMEEALERMEAGEDPDTIENELSDQLDAEEISFEMLKSSMKNKVQRPAHDETLYEL